MKYLKEDKNEEDLSSFVKLLEKNNELAREEDLENIGMNI